MVVLAYLVAGGGLLLGFVHSNGDILGRRVVKLPLTLGVVGALLLPALVALGAIAALAAHYTLEVERQEAETRVPAPVP